MDDRDHIKKDLCDGYRLPVRAVGTEEDIEAIYMPVINQVWIKGLLPEKTQNLILSHEFIHAYMASMQPPRLLPLSKALLSTETQWSKRFENIIENATELYYQIQISFPNIENIFRYIENARDPQTFEELLKLWIKITAKASPKLRKEIASKEGIIGLCILLMHIIPHHPDNALTILQEIQNISLPENWFRSQDIWGHLYTRLDKRIVQSNELKKQFTLAMPLGVHRFIADTLFFTAAAIKMVVSDPKIITAVFPTLLELLTQESFIILPVLTTIKSSGKYFSGIKVIHTTYRSPRIPDRLASRLQAESHELMKEGKFCCATSIFVSLVDRSREYRLSNTQDRTYKCFQTMLELLPELLKKHFTNKPSCSGCALLFQEKQFPSCFETIINMSSKTKRDFIKAAKDYRMFLQTDTMQLIQKKWKLPEEPEAICKYTFL